MLTEGGSGPFVDIGKTEFNKILFHKPLVPATTEDALQMLRKGLLRIQELPKFHKNTKVLIPLDSRMQLALGLPEITVFNSRSHALPSLVSLFNIQNRMENWIEEYENCLGKIISKEHKKILTRYLRLGFGPRLIPLILKDSSLLTYLPDLSSIDKDWETISRKLVREAVNAGYSGNSQITEYHFLDK